MGVNVKKIFALLNILLLSLVCASCVNNTIDPNNCEHEYVVTDKTDSTCKEMGSQVLRCSKCNDAYMEDLEIVDHVYENRVCIWCEKKENENVSDLVFEIFGDDVVIYDSSTPNPYGIDVKKYGSNVSVIFYTPDYTSYEDPYVNVKFDEFYANYDEASSVEDAYYRTQHHFISGDITEQGHIPPQSNYKEGDEYIRCTSATYVLTPTGDYVAYIPNDFNNEMDYIIYYGAGYQSINDVAAYLLAFGEVPANNNYDKSQGKNLTIDHWGIYGRVNNSSFSGDTSKYPYEPLLPGIGSVSYIETDFGTKGGYITSNSITGTYYNQGLYNNGKSITRGAARFVFVTKKSRNSIDDRYVFYTYNHYNDFQEYLNYVDGFGLRFGNQSAGNEYCGGNKDYYASNKYPITLYPRTVLKSKEEMN